MEIALKVKAASLAAEARIIRNLERSLRSRKARSAKYAAAHQGCGAEHAALFHEQRMFIQNHRRMEIRSEARSTHLARAFLRGTPYAKVEAKCWTLPDWNKVVGMVKRYMVPDQDNRPIADRVKVWRDAA